MGKGGRCLRLTTLPPSCAVVMKSENLNFLELSGSLPACNGTALRFCLVKYYWKNEKLRVPDCPVRMWRNITYWHEGLFIGCLQKNKKEQLSKDFRDCVGQFPRVFKNAKPSLIFLKAIHPRYHKRPLFWHLHFCRYDKNSNHHVGRKGLDLSVDSCIVRLRTS